MSQRAQYSLLYQISYSYLNVCGRFLVYEEKPTMTDGLHAENPFLIPAVDIVCDYQTNPILSIRYELKQIKTILSLHYVWPL